jgi:hypothetical protein
MSSGPTIQYVGATGNAANWTGFGVRLSREGGARGGGRASARARIGGRRRWRGAPAPRHLPPIAKNGAGSILCGAARHTGACGGDAALHRARAPVRSLLPTPRLASAPGARGRVGAARLRARSVGGMNLCRSEVGGAPLHALRRRFTGRSAVLARAPADAIARPSRRRCALPPPPPLPSPAGPLVRGDRFPRLHAVDDGQVEVHALHRDDDRDDQRARVPHLLARRDGVLPRCALVRQRGGQMGHPSRARSARESVGAVP